MRVLISGSTGLIGSALVKTLVARGDQVARLVRPGASMVSGSVPWDPETGTLDIEILEGFNAVVHLAAENLASGRWTPDLKKRLRTSRIRGTSLLCSRLINLKFPPEVVVLASAVGYYGNRGSEELTEESTNGQGFLAELTRDWETASALLDDSPIRAVRLRIGVVLTAEGGALARMLPIFRRGMGGKIGSGRQYLSWIAIDDLVAVIKYALVEKSLKGAINACAPNPVTNREFSRTLGRVLGRPAFMRVPGTILKLVGSEMVEELLLSSTRALPKRLEESGFQFRHPELAEALRHLLKMG